jgi:hypothetical protein
MTAGLTIPPTPLRGTPWPIGFNEHPIPRVIDVRLENQPMPVFARAANVHALESTPFMEKELGPTPRHLLLHRFFEF